MTNPTSGLPENGEALEQRLREIERDLDAGYEGIGAEHVQFLLSALRTAREDSVRK